MPEDLNEEKATSMVSSYMHWYGPTSFFRCELDLGLKNTDIGIAGVPYCGGNPVERMQYLGPRAVRNRSMGYARAHREFGLVPFDLCRIRDIGDAPILVFSIRILPPRIFQEWYEKSLAGRNYTDKHRRRPFHNMAILRAARATTFREPIAMIHFDAHTDALPELAGTKHTAGGFGFGAADQIIDRTKTVQIGIRGPIGSLQQDDWAKELGFRMITTDEFLDNGVEFVIKEVRRIIGDTPAYLSFDLDALDPVYAPGVADPEIDGLPIREVRKLLFALRGMNLIGADFVCYCPPLDNPNQITALTTCLMIHDVMTMMAEKKHSQAKRLATAGPVR